jgi:GNAT superfamily N-acetyltransferase
MPVSVRTADPDDPADVAVLRALRRAWTEEDAGQAIDDATYEARFDDWLATEVGHRRSYVAEDDGSAIGMASLVVMRRMPRPGRPPSDWGYVHQFFVVSERRSTGVGSALMAALIREARAGGLTQLVLNPTERSVTFYERHGFRPAEHLRHLILD